MSAPHHQVTVTLVRDDPMCFIPVPFDPKAVFGKVRAPVVVTLNGYTFRSTLAAMGNGVCIPLRRSHREAAGLAGTETLDVIIALDDAPRTVDTPDDLAQALADDPQRQAQWARLSYTHQREHVEALAQAKGPATRARRLAKCLQMLDG
jgi:hypothetical protein